MFAALADGESHISGYSPGADCAATLGCLRALGVAIRAAGPSGWAITGRGLGGLRAPDAPLDAVNSGTTMRLLAGILAGHAFRTVIGGDDSLQRRPMRRIIEPLTRMGARIDSTDGRAPLTIDGGGLQGIVYEPEMPERPGQERRPAGGPACVRPHQGRRAGAYAGSYGTRAGSVRRAPWFATVRPSRSPGASGSNRAPCRCRGTSPARHSGRPWPAARPGPPSRSRASD